MSARPPLSRGLTLVELVLALGLASLLLAALFQLLDTSLTIWRRGEASRSLLEQAGITGELLAADLRRVDGSRRSDLLVEWAHFDTDADGAVDSYWPRMRAVRRATPTELQRLQAGRAAPVNDRGLIEVVWCPVPAGSGPEERDTALLLRGERLVGDPDTRSFFDSTFFGASNVPSYAEVEEVTSGVLWIDILLATQTSIVRDGWKKGSALRDVATCWDAWGRGRPQVGWHPWNEVAAGVPRVADRPVLPRRARLELELERPVDRRRRPYLERSIGLTETSFDVDAGGLLPREVGAFIKLGPEWMRTVGVQGERVTVRRGERGTRPVAHPAGAMVHWGLRTVREVPIALYRDDWNIR